MDKDVYFTQIYSYTHNKVNDVVVAKRFLNAEDKVLIIDDLLATGGTVEATIKLVESLGGVVVGCAFLIELLDLKGRDKIGNYRVETLIQY